MLIHSLHDSAIYEFHKLDIGSSIRRAVNISFKIGYKVSHIPYQYILLYLSNGIC